MYKCEKCEKEFKTYQALNSHNGWHSNSNRENNLSVYNDKLKENIECNLYNCTICSKIFKTQQALNSHKGWHNNPNRENNPIDNLENYRRLVKNGEIKGENQYTKAKKRGETIIVSEETRNKISEKNRNRVHSEESKKKISDSMKLAVLRYPDSYSINNVSGRVKTLEYNGTKLKGKWELLVAKYLDENNIKWINKIDGISYIWEESEHLYFPDFYLTDYNMYVEVKGYQRDRDLYKWKVVNNLILIKKNEISNINKNKYNIFDYLK